MYKSVIVRQCGHDPSANLKHTYINSCASDILKTILIGLLLLFVRLFSSFEIMAFLLIIVLLSTTGTLIDSATNKTDCDLKPNNSSCTQAIGCGQSPCEMLCGLTTPYDTCQQSCGSNECNVLQCRASDVCTQICILTNCGSLTCDAN